MWDSGTPFCMSSSIAWLAELPSQEKSYIIKFYFFNLQEQVKKTTFRPQTG